MIKVLFLNTLIMMAMACVSITAQAQSGVIGRGNVVSKRVALAFHHDRARAHKLRLDSIKAKKRN